MSEELSVINRVYDLYKILLELHAHCDKRWRYSLCVVTEKALSDCLREILMAKYAPVHLKAPYILRALGLQELTVLKLRLYLELAVANETKVFQAQAKLAEVGRMLGGWLSSVQS